MNTLLTKLMNVRDIADDTIEIHLEKPDGFQFQPGQHLNLNLGELKHEDSRGARRTFSFTSAPYEEQIILATRQTRSGFKKTLEELPAGTEVEFKGPMGEMVMDPEIPAVFLAGGIGITPFRSMILQTLHENRQTPMTLLYSNRYPGASAFHSLFTQLANDHESFSYIPTFPDDDARLQDWDGERRKFTEAFINDYVKNPKQVIFYMAAPPGMTDAVTETLKNMEISEDNFRKESFWGY